MGGRQRERMLNITQSKYQHLGELSHSEFSFKLCCLNYYVVSDQTRIRTQTDTRALLLAAALSGLCMGRSDWNWAWKAVTKSKESEHGKVWETFLSRIEKRWWNVEGMVDTSDMAPVTPSWDWHPVPYCHDSKKKENQITKTCLPFLFTVALWLF